MKYFMLQEELSRKLKSETRKRTVNNLNIKVKRILEEGEELLA